MAEHSTAPVTEVRVDVQEPTSWSRRLSITVPSERVRRVRQSVSAKIAGNVRLPGFRKGKTPASLVERQFGPAIEQETVDRVIQETYREALDSHEFRPITQGQVESVHYHGDGGDLHFEVEFEVQPVLDLARTDGFDVVRPADAIGDDEVDALLERLRGERAHQHSLEEGAKPDYGDTVLVHITDLDEAGEGEGEAAEGSEYRFELGEGQAIPDIEAAIMTLAPGEEGEFTVTFPEDFADEAQRGQQQRLRIRVVEARRKELPALDDEFAQGLGDFESLEALRTRVRADLQNDATKRADSALRDALVQQIVEANPFDVPASMVDRYLSYMMGENPDAEGGRRTRSPEDEERFSQLRAIMRPQAEAMIKRMMVVEHIAEREGLRPTADDVDARVEALAEQHGRTPSELWVELERSGQMQGLEAEILEDKVFEHLQSRNTVAQA
ncbi:trigger factor [Longimicrobium sp.]|uniref:trigger factor n=1 Tax=Longimicrobium sp. TaxID=2029185 RepID=UPI003B3B2F70